MNDYKNKVIIFAHPRSGSTSLYKIMKILSYQLPEDIYKRLLNRSDCRVIFLWRANYLKSVVSVLIAEQTQIWQKSDFNKISGAYEHLKPLKIDDIDGIEKRIKGMREGIRYWDEIISKKPEETYYKVTYENLYCDDLEQKLARVKDIFGFLGLEMPETGKFIRFLESRNEQINTSETYLAVPNIREIESRFGNRENGHLF